MHTVSLDNITCLNYIKGLKRPPAQVATGGTTTSAIVVAPMAEGKCPERKLQLVITTMCASGVLALVDRRITPQVQGAKVRVQGTKVRTEGEKVRTSNRASR